MTKAVLSRVATVKQYYDLIDSGDIERAFLSFADNASVRFGDRPTLQGRETIAEHIRRMVAIARAVSHEIVRAYELPGPDDRSTIICEVVVTYTMLKSGNVIPHNAVTISEVDLTGKIVEQRNVGDLGPVLADHQAHTDSPPQ